jgi:hypothetical protein
MRILQRASIRGAVSEWVVVCFEGAVSLESCKQLTAAAPITEYQACGAAAREALSIRS